MRLPGWLLRMRVLAALIECARFDPLLSPIAFLLLLLQMSPHVMESGVLWSYHVVNEPLTNGNVRKMAFLSVSLTKEWHF